MTHVAEPPPPGRSHVLGADERRIKRPPVHRTAILRREHLGFDVPAIAGAEPFVGLLGALGLERIEGALGRTERPSASLCLDFRQLPTTIKLPARSQCPDGEVDVRPSAAWR